MIFLYSDFGSADIYVGQVKARLLCCNPQPQCIDLLHDAPNFDPLASAHLLAALAPQLSGAVTLAVVDAGVGSSRRPIVMEADDAWFVGPDNGLFSVISARAKVCRYWEIHWRPDHLSCSFHGRDLFAPVAALLDADKHIPEWLVETDRLEVNFGADDLPRVIYVDHYGNAITGMRASHLTHDAALAVAGQILRSARVFHEVPVGVPFWYENSIGLVELAVNRGSAAQLLGLTCGSTVDVSPAAA